MRYHPALRVLLLALLGMFALSASHGQGFDGLGGLGGKGSPTMAEAEAVPVVRVSARPLETKVTPGGALGVAVVLDHADHWHTWPSASQDVLPEEIAEFAIRTSIVGPEPAPSWLAGFGDIQWPEPLPGKVADINHPGQKVELPLYQGKAVAYVPIFISESAPLGTVSLTFTVDYQACDDSVCEAPESVNLTVEFQIVDGGLHGRPPVPDDELQALRAGFDAQRLATRSIQATPSTPASAPSRVGSSFFGLSLAGLTGWFGFAVLALLSAVGGLVLNLTPCVLPVIPIKVMTLTRHAGSPGRSLVLGIWMALGVIAFWVGLGVPAAAFSSFADPTWLFGIWWLTTAVGVIIALMGVGIMGLFTFNLPQQVYMVNPEADSPAGSFMFGVMTAVLGLPCFGFVAGALLPAAGAIGPSATLTVFASIGVGMALPYLVLAARPSLVEKLPRTGPASELVKQVMGLLLLAAAAYFIGAGLIALVQDYPYLSKQLHWWAVGLLAASAGGWLTIQTFRITPRVAPRVIFLAIGLAFGAAGVSYALKSTADARHEYEGVQLALAKQQFDGALLTSVWVDYSEMLFAKAEASGKVIVMDFTAEWCLNCKALKAAVLNVDPVRPVLESDDVVMIRVDLTSRRAPGWDKLRALGQTGIPLLVVQGPGLAEPWMSNAYTSDQVLEAVRRAGGPSSKVSQAR